LNGPPEVCGKNPHASACSGDHTSLNKKIYPIIHWPQPTHATPQERDPGAIDHLQAGQPRNED